MDIFTHSRHTHGAGEQSRLASQRNPGSLSRGWQNAAPLHGLSAAARNGVGNLANRLQRIQSLPTIGSAQMFPFRIYQQPPLLQRDPAWQDSYGNAGWRTFQVWTAMAVAYQIMENGANAPSGMQIGVPQLVYVARTSGYNLAGLTSVSSLVANAAADVSNSASNSGHNVNSTIISTLSIPGTNYDEGYAAQVTGIYPANPCNPSNTGPTYVNNYDEVTFTAPPSSIAVFWISWDVNNYNAYPGCSANSSVANGALQFNSSVLEESYAAFPVLHFGWYSSAGTYGGDLNSTNGPNILGFLASDYNGSPSQLYPYIPANALGGDFSTGTQTPEGVQIIGAVQVGALGAFSNTGNDGIVQIFQAQFDNIIQPMTRIQYRGTYSSANWYYPNEIVVETSGANTSTFINATPFALQNYDPYVNQSNAPLTDGVNYTSFTNLWIPLGGAGSSSGGSTYRCNVISEGHNTVICNVAGGVSIVTSINTTNGGNYTTLPTVSITGGGGSGATATAAFNSGTNGPVHAILETGGSGYTNASNLVFTFTGTNTLNATATGTIGNGLTVAKPEMFRGFVATTNDAQGTAQKIVPSYSNSNNSQIGVLVATFTTGGTNIANVTYQDINENPRALMTQLHTSENINGNCTNANRWFDCSTYF